MNLSEFKHWFEGFTDNLDGVPNAKAWAKIKVKIGEIKDAPATSYPVFVERYRPYWQSPYWYYGSFGGSSGGVAGGAIALTSGAVGADAGLPTNMTGIGARSHYAGYSNAEAFKSLGRAEALELNAA